MDTSALGGASGMGKSITGVAVLGISVGSRVRVGVGISVCVAVEDTLINSVDVACLFVGVRMLVSCFGKLVGVAKGIQPSVQIRIKPANR
jgi:hypothetical protein